MGSGVEQDLCGSRVASLVGDCESVKRLVSIWCFLAEKEIYSKAGRFKEVEAIMEGI